MKLCRFELLSAPEQVRSGIVYSGKVYETDGENPIAVHEAEHIRPLPPIGQPPSIRFFRSRPMPEPSLPGEDPLPPLFFYGNPTSLIGASQIVAMPGFTQELDFEPYVAAVVGEAAYGVTPDAADNLILGFTIVTVLVARDAEREERAGGLGPGRSFDVGIAVGPVLTTPDEVNDAVVDEERGMRYKMAAVARVNGVEIRRGDTEDLPHTFAEAISAASESCVLHPGDLIALGPVAVAGEERRTALEPGDEIQVAIDRLGTLSTKIAV